MSLAITFKGAEGVVLAADSRVTITIPVKPAGATQDWLLPATYDNATKLLKVTGQDHVAAVTYGAGAIGFPEPRTAHSLLVELEAALASEPRLSVEQFAKKLGDFFCAQWNARVPQGFILEPMCFLVCGYDENAPYGRIFEVVVPSRPDPVEKQANDFGLMWGGQQEITGRILNGFDPGGLDAIKAETGVDDAKLAAIAGKITEVSGAKIPYQFLPLQDCVDLSILLIRTTSQLMDYQTAIRGVGGAIDVATITRQEGFRYVQRKEIRGERA